jgi:hypothetical protein
LSVLPDGQIQVREASVIQRGGVADPGYAPRYRRYVLAPGDDLTGKAPRITALANALWTPDVVAAWHAAQAAARDAARLAS